MYTSYSQDHPSQDHSSSSNRPFIPFSHGSLQSPRRLFPAPDELSSPDQPTRSTRASIFSNPRSESVSSNHYFSEDLNNYPPTQGFFSASRSNSPDSGSFDYSQPVLPPLPTRASELGSASGRGQNFSNYFLSEHSFNEDLNSYVSGQPPIPPAYPPVRPHRDSLSLPARPSAQQSRRESGSLAPVVWDPNSVVTQRTGRRDSVIFAPQPPPSHDRNPLSVVQAPPLQRAPVLHPAVVPFPPAASRRAPESSSHGQGTLVSRRVRFNDESPISSSPMPMRERRKGWYNRRG